MKIIVPNQLSLLSCSIAESDATDGVLWNSATSYAKDAKVRRAHITYTSLIDGNKGNDPALTWHGEDAKWKRIEATAPWRMLDDYVETQTKAPAGQALSFCVPFNRADSFTLLNMQGAEIEIKIYDEDEPEGEQLVYEETRSLIQDIFHLSLYEYNYLPIVCITGLSIANLPQVFNGRLCITITPGGDEDVCAVGHVVAGIGRELGYSQYGSEWSFTDYSRKTTDEFGATTLVKRSYASRESLSVYLHPDQFDYVTQTLTSVRGTPCVWIGDNVDDGHQSLTVFGWLEDARMVCEGPNEIQMSLEIQGLI